MFTRVSINDKLGETYAQTVLAYLAWHSYGGLGEVCQRITDLLRFSSNIFSIQFRKISVISLLNCDEISGRDSRTLRNFQTDIPV